MISSKNTGTCRHGQGTGNREQGKYSHMLDEDLTKEHRIGAGINREKTNEGK